MIRINNIMINDINSIFLLVISFYILYSKLNVTKMTLMLQLHDFNKFLFTSNARNCLIFEENAQPQVE